MQNDRRSNPALNVISIIVSVIGLIISSFSDARITKHPSKRLRRCASLQRDGFASRIFFRPPFVVMRNSALAAHDVSTMKKSY